MRPKRVILVIDPCADRCSETRLVLRTHTYWVSTAPSVYAAAEVAHDTNPDLLLGYSPISDEYLMQMAGDLGIPWLFIGPGEHGAWPPMKTILDRIKIATARKRGPRPGFRIVTGEIKLASNL